MAHEGSESRNMKSLPRSLSINSDYRNGNHQQIDVHIGPVVRDYDEAIAFYTEELHHPG